MSFVWGVQRSVKKIRGRLFLFNFGPLFCQVFKIFFCKNFFCKKIKKISEIFQIFEIPKNSQKVIKHFLKKVKKFFKKFSKCTKWVTLGKNNSPVFGNRIKIGSVDPKSQKCGLAKTCHQEFRSFRSYPKHVI